MTAGEIEPYYERRPGDLVFTNTELQRFPDGTSIVHGGDVFIKRGEAWARETGRRTTNLSPSPHGETALKAYPEGYDYPHDTLEQYQWKVRDVVLTAAARHGVSGVPETLANLEVTEEKFPIGRGARIINPATLNDLRVLPCDSIISYGHPNAEDFALYRRTDFGWTRIYGPSHHQQSGGAVVEEVGGVGLRYGWLELRGDSSADPAIDEFKVKTWDEGRRGSSRHSWCGVWLQVVNYLGINEQLVTDIKNAHATNGHPLMHGQRVTPAEAATCPIGTVFQWVNGDGDLYWFQRAQRSNLARCRRVYAVDAEGNKLQSPMGQFASNGMTLLGYPGECVEMQTDNLLGRMQALSPRMAWGFQPDFTTPYYMSEGLGGDSYFGPQPIDRAYRIEAYANSTEHQTHEIYVRIADWSVGA